LGPRAQQVLVPFMDREPERYCFVPAESFQQCKDRLHAKRVTPLSCGNRPGSARKKKTILKPSQQTYSNDSYRRAIHRACDKAQVPRWSPNQLRHSAATKIRARYGLEQARVVLGHSTTTTTEIYAERDLQAAAEVARQLG
jgi:integrase